MIGEDRIFIKRPTEPIRLDAGKKAKQVVILATNKELVKDDRKDTPLHIKIRAYAIDDKEKVAVERDTVFIYPRIDLLEESED